jgi:uncharacterized protein YifN (PemK superfamily)
MPYHCCIELERPLPPPFEALVMWVKADMVATVSFDRLDLFNLGKGPDGKRIYDIPVVEPDVLMRIRHCVMRAIGLVPP